MGVITTDDSGQVLYESVLTAEGIMQLTAILIGSDTPDGFGFFLKDADDNIIDSEDALMEQVNVLETGDGVRYYAEKVAVNNGTVVKVELQKNTIVLWYGLFETTPAEISVGQTWLIEDVWTFFQYDSWPDVT